MTSLYSKEQQRAAGLEYIKDFHPSRYLLPSVENVGIVGENIKLGFFIETEKPLDRNTLSETIAKAQKITSIKLLNKVSNSYKVHSSSKQHYINKVNRFFEDTKIAIRSQEEYISYIRDNPNGMRNLHSLIMTKQTGVTIELLTKISHQVSFAKATHPEIKYKHALPTHQVVKQQFEIYTEFIKNIIEEFNEKLGTETPVTLVHIRPSSDGSIVSSILAAAGTNTTQPDGKVDRILTEVNKVVYFDNTPIVEKAMPGLNRSLRTNQQYAKISNIRHTRAPSYTLKIVDNKVKTYQTYTLKDTLFIQEKITSADEPGNIINRSYFAEKPRLVSYETFMKRNFKDSLMDSQGYPIHEKKARNLKIALRFETPEELNLCEQKLEKKSQLINERLTVKKTSPKTLQIEPRDKEELAFNNLFSLYFPAIYVTALKIKEEHPSVVEVFYHTKEGAKVYVSKVETNAYDVTQTGGVYRDNKARVESLPYGEVIFNQDCLEYHFFVYGEEEI